MSEKPQTVREDESEDLLEQIITQGLEKMNAPAQATAAEEAPKSETAPVPGQKDSAETAPSADRKNKRSAVYLYLLILFGAAFLMLLLAYFVQQRSNENTISDLRDSMNLSREELLDEISALEEKNTALSEEIDRLQADRQAYEEQVQEEVRLWGQNYTDVLDKLYGWSSFWELEQYYQAEDLQNCAAVLLLLELRDQSTYRTPDNAQERYTEIVRAVIDAGILDEDYHQHPDDYKDLLDAYFSDW